MRTLLAETYARLTPWQKTQVARHPMRPHFRDYVEYIFEEFVPLGGDRFVVRRSSATLAGDGLAYLAGLLLRWTRARSTGTH